MSSLSIRSYSSQSVYSTDEPNIAISRPVSPLQSIDSPRWHTAAPAVNPSTPMPPAPQSPVMPPLPMEADVNALFKAHMNTVLRPGSEAAPKCNALASLRVLAPRFSTEQTRRILSVWPPMEEHGGWISYGNMRSWDSDTHMQLRLLLQALDFSALGQSPDLEILVRRCLVDVATHARKRPGIHDNCMCREDYNALVTLSALCRAPLAEPLRQAVVDALFRSLRHAEKDRRWWWWEQGDALRLMASMAPQLRGDEIDRALAHLAQKTVQINATINAVAALAALWPKIASDAAPENRPRRKGLFAMLGRPSHAEQRYAKARATATLLLSKVNDVLAAPDRLSLYAFQRHLEPGADLRQQMHDAQERLREMLGPDTDAEAQPSA